MPYNFKDGGEGVNFLLPPSIQEWVPAGSLSHFIWDVVERLHCEGRLERFYKRYNESGVGSAAHHPKLMTRILLYGYCLGVTSSRKLERELETDVAFRYLAVNLQPDFRTIALFRKRHLADLDALFVEVLELCSEAGLVKMGKVALDGRKVPANASLAANRRLEHIKAEVKSLLEKAEREDEEEDALYGPDKRGDELPEGLRDPNERMRRLIEAGKRLEQKAAKEREERERKIAEREQREREETRKLRGRKPKAPKDVTDPEGKANITDPDSRILKTRSHGYIQGYNGQAMVECSSQVIVAQGLTNDENDIGQLEPMLAACEVQAKEKPGAVLADAGYCSDANLDLESGDTEFFINTMKDWKRRKELRLAGAPRGRIPSDTTKRERMERKLLTKRGSTTYSFRCRTVEPVFGQMLTRGLSNFLLRGLAKVKVEWSMWCSTHNLLKLWRSGWVPNI
jgi:transposase